MHRLPFVALALAACLPPTAPDRWTHEIDLSDRKDIIEFDVVMLGADVVWRIAGSFDDRVSRFGRVGADGLEVWTRDLDDDAALVGLAATGPDSLVGLIHDRNTGDLLLRGFDGAGDEAWSQPWDEDAWGRPDELVAGDKSLYVATDRGVIACSKGGADCREHFALDPGTGVFELVPLSNGRLVVQTIDLDRIVTIALDADAQPIATHDSEGELVWDVAAGGDVVYLRHGSDSLTRMDLTSGALYTALEPEGTMGIGATKSGELLAIEFGWDEDIDWDEDQLSVYSSDFELLRREPIPMGGDQVRQRDDGTLLVWASEYEFPNLWIAAIGPQEH